MKADKVTIKTCIISTSHHKKFNFHRTCSQCPPLRCTHTWSLWAKLSITLTHSSLYRTNLISYGRHQLCYWLWIVIVNIVFQKNTKINVWGFISGECGDHSGTSRMLINQSGKDDPVTPWWALLCDEMCHLVETIALHFATHHEH